MPNLTKAGMTKGGEAEAEGIRKNIIPTEGSLKATNRNKGLSRNAWMALTQSLLYLI
jgi:hypothetical protein